MLVLKAFGLLLLTLLTVLLLKDAYVYFTWLRLYKKQGIQLEYVPFLGLHYYLLVALHPFFESGGSLKKYMPSYFSGKDSGAKFKQLEERRRGQDIVASNHITGCPSLLILKPELIQEAMLKDNDVMKRYIPLELPISAGFMAENGPKALHQRGIFAKFFQFDQLMALTPKIVQIVQRNLQTLKQNFSSIEEEFPENFKFVGKTFRLWLTFR